MCVRTALRRHRSSLRAPLSFRLALQSEAQSHLTIQTLRTVTASFDGCVCVCVEYFLPHIFPQTNHQARKGKEGPLSFLGPHAATHLTSLLRSPHMWRFQGSHRRESFKAGGNITAKHTFLYHYRLGSAITTLWGYGLPFT